MNTTIKAIKAVNLGSFSLRQASSSRDSLETRLIAMGIDSHYQNGRPFFVAESVLTEIVDKLELAKKEGVKIAELPTAPVKMCGKARFSCGYAAECFDKIDGVDMASIVFKDYLTGGLLARLSAQDLTAVLQAFAK